MIPKVIHYCWLSGDPIPEKLQRCMDSWKKFLPDYEFVLWDLERFDIKTSQWVKEAFEARKYAFAADYIRLYAVYNYGGIYMDLGSELIRDIDDLTSLYECISAIEKSTCTVNSGLLLACKEHDSFVGEMLNRYDDLQYVNSDSFRISHTVNEMFTELLEEKGFERRDKTQYIDKWIILSSDYFNPVYGVGGYHIKKNTYSIHRYTASWREPKEKYKDYMTHHFAYFFGNRFGNVLSRMITEIKFEDLSNAVTNIQKKSLSEWMYKS